MSYQFIPDTKTYDNMLIKMFAETRSTQEVYDERNLQIGPRLIYFWQRREPQNG